MNDFTKDELEDLLSICEHSDVSCIEYMEKLTSLIDNYCEHENVKSLSDTDYVYCCSECGEFVGFK
jgi:hypothetical protein